MRVRGTALALVLVAAVLLGGCGKKSETTPRSPSPPSSTTATTGYRY